MLWLCFSFYRLLSFLPLFPSFFPLFSSDLFSLSDHLPFHLLFSFPSSPSIFSSHACLSCLHHLLFFCPLISLSSLFTSPLFSLLPLSLPSLLLSLSLFVFLSIFSLLFFLLFFFLPSLLSLLALFSISSPSPLPLLSLFLLPLIFFLSISSPSLFYHLFVYKLYCCYFMFNNIYYL